MSSFLFFVLAEAILVFTVIYMLVSILWVLTFSSPLVVAGSIIGAVVGVYSICKLHKEKK